MQANISFSKVALPLATSEAFQVLKLNSTSLQGYTIFIFKLADSFTVNLVMLVKSNGTKKPTIAVSDEVCPRRRQTEECETASREVQVWKTLAALRHDVLHAGRPSARAAEQPHSIYRNIDLGMVWFINYIRPQ